MRQRESWKTRAFLPPLSANTRRQIAAKRDEHPMSCPQRQLPQAVVDFGRGCLAKRVLRPGQSIPAMRSGITGAPVLEIRF